MTNHRQQRDWGDALGRRATETTGHPPQPGRAPGQEGRGRVRTGTGDSSLLGNGHPGREVQTDDVDTWTLHLSLDVITGESPEQLGCRGPSRRLPEAPSIRTTFPGAVPGSSCCGVSSVQAGPPLGAYCTVTPHTCVCLWQLLTKHQRCRWAGDETPSQLPVDFYVLHSFLQQPIEKREYIYAWKFQTAFDLGFLNSFTFRFCSFTLFILDCSVFSFMTNKMEKPRTRSENRSVCKRQPSAAVYHTDGSFLERTTSSHTEAPFLTESLI